MNRSALYLKLTHYKLTVLQNKIKNLKIILKSPKFFIPFFLPVFEFTILLKF